jgi:YegS/Rv2252/BmrU family lipid kinase
LAERLRVLANPGGGRGRVGRHRREVEGAARRLGAPLHFSRDTADLEAQARRAAADGVERLLVAGGDGTLHYAVLGLAGSETALAVLPLGSGNDLAGALGVPRDLDAAAALAAGGPSRRIDLVRCGPTLFAGVAGVGFDSEVNRYANERVRHLRGPLIYVWSVLRVLRTFRPLRLRAVHDEGAWEGRAMFAVVANAPRYGGNMRIAPAALLDDGLLDLVIVREVSKLQLLRVFPRVFAGRHVTHPAVVLARSSRVTLALDRETTAYGDGEPLVPIGATPVEFAVMPAALRVVAP